MSRREHKVVACFFSVLLTGVSVFLPRPCYAQEEQPDYYPLQMSVIIDEREAGVVDGEASVEGQARLAKDDLLRVTSEKLDDDVLDRIRTAFPERDILTIEEIRETGLDISYDPSRLVIVVRPPGDQRRVNTLSITDQTPGTDMDPTEPAFLAAGTDFTVTQRFQHEDPNGGDTRENLAGEAEGFVRVGKKHPVYLNYLLEYDEEEGVNRNQTTLFYDETESATRYAAGDVSPRSIGFQTPLQMGGASIERQYEEIQPYRRVLPGGQSQLVLDQRARVEIEINGVQTRTVILDPGRYDVRDFPLVDGFNNVRLIVTNASGAQQVLTYDFLSDTRLLKQGLHDFSISAGVARDTEENEVQYEGPEVVSGWYEAGITDNFTGGLYGQGTKEEGLGGARAALGTGLGLFGLDVAHNGQSLEDGYAAEASYSWWSENGTEGFMSDKQVDLSLQTTGEDFNRLTDDEPFSDYKYEAEARFQTQLSLDSAMSIGARHQDGRNEFADRQQINSTFSQSFDRITANLTMEAERENGGGFEDGEVFLAVNIPFGIQDSVRMTASTDDNLVETRYSHRRLDGVNQYGGEVGVFTSDEEKGATGRFDYAGNRFGVELKHDYTQDEIDGEIIQESAVTGRTGIGFADGKVGIGRTVLPGFILADQHKSIENSPVTAYKEGLSDVPYARTDALGPAVIPIDRQYVDRAYEFEVEDLPQGYDIGSARVDVVPGAYSGYVHKVGKAENITAIGTLIGYDNEPMGYASGKVVAVDEDKEPSLFFTNKTGRLVADSLAPGEYDLILNETGKAIATISIPEDHSGMYEIGTIRMGDPT